MSARRPNASTAAAAGSAIAIVLAALMASMTYQNLLDLAECHELGDVLGLEHAAEAVLERHHQLHVSGRIPARDGRGRRVVAKTFRRALEDVGQDLNDTGAHGEMSVSLSVATVAIDERHEPRIRGLHPLRKLVVPDHYWTAADETRGRERALEIRHRRRALDHVRAGCTQEPGRLLNEPLGKPGPTPRPQQIHDPAPQLAAAHVRAQDEVSTDVPAVAEQEPP